MNRLRTDTGVVAPVDGKPGDAVAYLRRGRASAGCELQRNFGLNLRHGRSSEIVRKRHRDVDPTDDHAAQHSG